MRLSTKNRYPFLLALSVVSCQSPNVEKQDSHLFSFSHFEPSAGDALGPQMDVGFFPEDEGDSPVRKGLLLGDPSQIVWPTSGGVTSEYGVRRGRLHGGIDIGGSPGSKIVAVDKGKVTFLGRKRGYGKVVILEHPAGYKTLYAHCSRIRNLRVNQEIRRGQVIAYMGKTGNANGFHLHFEYRTMDDTRLDPRMLLPRMDITLR